jgi:hypothetical protein
VQIAPAGNVDSGHGLYHFCGLAEGHLAMQGERTHAFGTRNSGICLGLRTLAISVLVRLSRGNFAKMAEIKPLSTRKLSHIHSASRPAFTRY